ncbi:'Cold-shock' DNA-binding domain-containing protein [Microbulbifer donghaiensis]|uniref:Cold shock-like protein CspD n=1 Tax=Microbulbifer donghaiensis TaxID=494016 RepID=A0A1M4V1X2_9GAMM|nr:cold shock domain-containing protein CspD [Microbulbifer donghaiensis]SHE62888.1 'Cold-shock' DNA-binding domain-containing protein [Microbulbifer donghaiensis]
MPTGTVKWFNNAKGYGFILADEGGEDLFAHYSAIQMEGYRTLKAGQQVTFDIIKGDKGFHAANISTVSGADAPHGDRDASETDSGQEKSQAQREKEAELLD